jgi:hypothetical protein
VLDLRRHRQPAPNTSRLVQDGYDHRQFLVDGPDHRRPRLSVFGAEGSFAVTALVLERRHRLVVHVDQS